VKVCVFCSANELPAKYTEPAAQFARELAANGHELVWGGSDSGLMGVIAAAVQEGGGRTVGISFELLAGTACQSADEMVIVKTLGERKALLLERSDVVVVLVGGIGTLDEATEIIELRKHRLHDKPILVLDTDGFYDGMRMQLDRMAADGFLPRPLEELVTFAESPEEAVAFIEQYASATAARSVS
jgi:uncharacterized protein (TIGR00730 family)